MLQAIICNPDGSKRVIVDGVEYAPADAGLTAAEWVEVNAAQYVAPVIPVPAKVSRAQLKLALLELGLLTTVEAAIGASNDLALQINWIDRLEFERDHALVVAMGQMLGKAPEEIDAVFILAATK